VVLRHHFIVCSNSTLLLLGERYFVAVDSSKLLVVVCRTPTKTKVDLELVDDDDQQTVKTFSIMLSSAGAADEFKKLFKEVS